MLNVYRINYANTSSLVAANSNTEAIDFVGAANVPVSVSEVARGVEVVGVDSPHAPVAPIPPVVAPYDLPKTVSRADFDAANKQISDLSAVVAALEAKLNVPAPVPSGK